jgi:DNA-directed RNA polymerase subunit RPC12/RpoP
MKVKCPECKSKIFGDKIVGQEITCFNCRHKFVVVVQDEKKIKL